MRIMRECKRHGMHLHYVRRDKYGGFRCSKCVQDAFNKHRRKLKQELVDMLGGSCKWCGYNRSLWSLDFHHRDNEHKLANVNRLINQKNRKKAIEEAKKCDLMCRNCHGEQQEQQYLEGQADGWRRHLPAKEASPQGP